MAKRKEKSASFRLTKKERITQIFDKPKEKFLTNSQEKLWNVLGENDITLCFGPSGVGKSHILLKKALDLIWSEDNGYEKIIITRPAVTSGEDIGLLPGNVEEKLFPYMFPSFYLIKKIIGDDNFLKLKEEMFLETIAFSFMRGLNIDNAILICEEAQNVSPEQMKTLLTRIGFNTKFFISGDLEQSDKYYKDKKKSGLFDAKNRLSDLENIGIFEFDNNDIVRHKIISQILERYNTK